MDIHSVSPHSPRSIDRNSNLAAEGHDLLNLSQDEVQVSQKVKDFVADSKNIPALFNRQPLERAESILSPTERVLTFIGGGALATLGVVGIGMGIGGGIALGLLLPPALLPLLSVIVPLALVAVIAGGTGVGFGGFFMYLPFQHAQMDKDPAKIETRELERAIEPGYYRGFNEIPSTSAARTEAIDLYKKGLMTAYPAGGLSDEVYALNIRQNPRLSAENKEVIIQQYLDHKKQVGVYCNQIREVGGHRIQLEEMYGKKINRELSIGSIVYEETRTLGALVKNFWQSQSQRVEQTQAFLETVQNENIIDHDKSRLTNGYKHEFNELQKDLAKAPLGVSAEWEAKYSTYVSKLSTLQERYEALLENAKKDAVMLHAIGNEAGLSDKQKQILQEDFLDQRGDPIGMQDAEKRQSLRDHYLYLAAQVKADEGLLSKVEADDKLSLPDRTEFALRFREKRKELMTSLTEKDPSPWRNQETETAFKTTFEEMRNHWEHELLQAEKWDSQKIDRDELTAQFPELKNEKSADYLEEALNSNNSYFARVAIIENAVKSVRNIELGTVGNLLSEKDRIKLESAVTTPWERLLLVEKAAHQQTLSQLVSRAQALTNEQLEIILRNT